ncbi:MAG: Guanine nucleotide-binding protein alpha-2 subunit [Tremellales sp. Tagirdzhanova-0007]|nr:MAG: Guanine nucleotide-binding protein alpha-2 subunit [Tremellales sp. Tagirdzhanova-0007]
MGGCMSSPSTETPGRSTDIKQVNPNVAATAKSSNPPASLNSKPPASNGTDEGVTDTANGNTAQGMSAALMATEPAAANGDRNRSNAIDRQLEDDSRRFKKECKILLLGSGESGKSTIVKQMKIIHQNGYSKEELLNFRMVVQKNVVDSAQALIMAMRKLGVDPEEPNNRGYADRILEYRMSVEPMSVASQDILRNIESLWHDPVIPSVMDRSSEFYMMDSATYFFANIRRVGSPDYIPDEADVLRARTKTTGISETRFNMGQLSIHMFDVGGQRSERKKWIHCFEAVTSIIFCVALSEYDQVLLEENGQNRMQESLVLFESVINSRWFLRTSVILFLNKIDVFKQKLPKVPLVTYFPEYTGGADINKAAKYILWRFTQTNRARLSVYPHLTQATDTSNIRLVFAAVKETILQNALRDSGIL